MDEGSLVSVGIFNSVLKLLCEHTKLSKLIILGELKILRESARAADSKHGGCCVGDAPPGSGLSEAGSDSHGPFQSLPVTLARPGGSSGRCVSRLG